MEDIDKTVAYKMVLHDLMQVDMLKGKYDAKNGSIAFMHGISTVMENIAMNVSEECYENFTDEFNQNIAWSQERANGKK